MKIIVIGDIHAKTIWKQIVAKELDNSDKIIFIGDYFDDYNGTNAQHQINNFKQIVDFKKLYPEKFILLFGNHDFQYLKGIDDRYSGYQSGAAISIQEAIHKDLEYLQMCYLYDNVIFSHAGVTNTWCKNNNIKTIRSDIRFDEQINELFVYKPSSFKFISGKNFSYTGDDICQTPIWVRPTSLVRDCMEGFIQVVGHTQQREINKYQNIYLIDALNVGQYLSINNSVFKICKI